MLLICGAVVSCSDDDDSNGGGGGKVPSGEDIGVTDRVVAIEENYGGTSVFNYTDGAMTSGTTMVDDFKFTISYNPLKIWTGFIENDGSYEVGETYSNIRTNSFGAIVSADIILHEKDMYGDYENTATFTAEYDDNNRIQKYKATTASGGYGNYSYETNTTINFTWNGNNLTEMNMLSEYRESDGGHVDEWSSSEGVIFVYGDGAVKNSGVYHPAFASDLDFMYYAGFLGRTTAYLPTSVIYTVDGKEVSRSDCDVEVDGQGRVTSISDGDETFTYYYADTYNPGSLRQAAKMDGSRKAHSGILSKIKSRMLKHRLVK